MSKTPSHGRLLRWHGNNISPARIGRCPFLLFSWTVHGCIADSPRLDRKLVGCICILWESVGFAFGSGLKSRLPREVGGMGYHFHSHCYWSMVLYLIDMNRSFNTNWRPLT